MSKRKRDSKYISNLANVGDKTAFVLPGGADISRIGLVILGADADGCTVAFNSLQGSTLGSADVGTITVPAADNTGQVLVEVPSSVIRLNPGAVIVDVTVDGGLTALAAVAFIEYTDVGEYNANSADVDAA